MLSQPPSLSHLCVALIRSIVGQSVVLLLVGVLGAGADETQIHLKNGDVLSGVVASESAGSVDLRHPALGLIHVPISQIVRRVNLNPAPPVAVVPPPAPVAPAPAVIRLLPTPSKPAKPKSDWHLDVQAGFDLGFGTGDRQAYNSRARATYGRGRLRNALDASFLFGETEGIKSADRLDTSMKTDYDLRGRLFLYNLGGAGYDDVRHINLRYEVGPGFGYHLVNRDSLKLNVELGGNFQTHQFADGSSSRSFFYRLAEDTVWKVTSKITIDQRFEFFPGISDMERFRMRFEGNLRYALRENLYLNLTALDIYDNQPAVGITKNDVQIRSSIGMKF